VAVSGTIHLDNAEIGGGAEGHYDVMMKSGAHLQGDFTADNCPALSSLFSSLNDTSDCSSSTSNFGDGGA
jgi:hypothetical protein